jgi:hypothetical protein
VWEQVDELWGFAAVGDEEQCVVLGYVLAYVSFAVEMVLLR